MSVRGLVEGMVAAVVLLDEGGTVVASSAAARRMLGDALDGRPLADVALQPEALSAQVRQWASSSNAAPGTFALARDGVVVRGDGRRLMPPEPYQVLVELRLRDEATKEFAALKRSLEELREEMRRRRTLEVRNGRLLLEQEAALKRARRLAKAKDELFSAVSHELRTPLNAIAGWAQLLATPRGPELLHQGVEVIRRNCEQQRSLIDDLVDVSRLESGAMQLRLAPIDVHQITQRAVDQLAHAAATAGVTVTLHKAGPPTPVVADPERLQQVVWNLLSNAIKFTPEGGSVQVEVRREPESVWILVTDTGRGMQPDHAANVFDPFWRGNSASDGLGLGLALVHQLVTLHGGIVTAHSDGEGKGCRFTVRLPDEAAPLTPAAPSDPKVDNRGPRLIGCRVLLVEDHDDARELLAHLLRGEGARVEVAAGVDSGLRHLGRQPYDILVSDLRLVEHGLRSDGCEMLRTLRASDGPNRDVPAIALTAYGGDAERRRTAEAGFARHLVKPVDADVLVQAIMRVLGVSSSA
jgi:signal transduction histidine kinase/ActR/RegA family two-component response regulator